MKMYHYPNCSTCKKARRFVDSHGQQLTALIDIVKNPPTESEIRDIWKRSGVPLRRLFNTSGQSYRQGGFKDRLPSMSEQEQISALAADGKLIRRPLLAYPQGALVGFKEPEWLEAFG